VDWEVEEPMISVSAMCGSLRRGSYNQSLLDAAVERAPAHGLAITQIDIARFPLFNQDLEHPEFPEPVQGAKAVIAASECLLLASPEHNFGVPGVLKNAIDWVSRPARDPALMHRPLAVMGASTGYMGTIRGQLAWRQMWHFFKAPVFSEVELTVSFAAKAVDDNGVLVAENYLATLEEYLEQLRIWLEKLACERP
jgi:chromate reductase